MTGFAFAYAVVRVCGGQPRKNPGATGSMGDIITYPIDVDPDLNISKVQLLDAIIHELSSNGFSDSEESDFWDDMMDLRKAKNIR